jgi:hypothetical protein
MVTVIPNVDKQQTQIVHHQQIVHHLQIGRFDGIVENLTNVKEQRGVAAQQTKGVHTDSQNGDTNDRAKLLTIHFQWPNVEQNLD